MPSETNNTSRKDKKKVIKKRRSLLMLNSMNFGEQAKIILHALLERSPTLVNDVIRYKIGDINNKSSSTDGGKVENNKKQLKLNIMERKGGFGEDNLNLLMKKMYVTDREDKYLKLKLSI